MSKGTSLYLDLVRFLAAFAVFAFHASGRDLTGGLLWRLGGMGTPAVSVFFVLSGYVISYVLSEREQTPLSFAASRFGRLYSVVLPALVLTAACDTLDALRNSSPSIARDYSQDLVLVRYAASSLFINRAWIISGFHGLEPGINGPFWSLSYETSYYVAIAAIVFSRGAVRTAILLGLCLLMGPTVALLAPIWFLGYAIHKWERYLRLSLLAAVAAWVFGLSICIFSTRFLQVRTDVDLPALAPHFFHYHSGTEFGDVLCRYIAATGFALNLIGFINLSPLLERVLSPFERSIRWLGSLTFALYLFHLPLLAFFSTYRIAPAGSLFQAVWAIGGVLTVVATLGRLSENSKGIYKSVFLRLFEMPRRFA